MFLYSESVGSVAGIHRMQCRRRSPLLFVLFPVPSAVTETPQVRHFVSCPRHPSDPSWATYYMPNAAAICNLTDVSFRWSVGSLLFLLSWAVLMGPWTYVKHLVSGPRLPFTAAYFGSIALTLYFAVGVSAFDFLNLFIDTFAHPPYSYPCIVWPLSRPSRPHYPRVFVQSTVLLCHSSGSCRTTSSQCNLAHAPRSTWAGVPLGMHACRGMTSQWSLRMGT